MSKQKALKSKHDFPEEAFVTPGITAAQTDKIQDPGATIIVVREELKSDQVSLRTIFHESINKGSLH